MVVINCVCLTKKLAENSDHLYSFVFNMLGSLAGLLLVCLPSVFCSPDGYIVLVQPECGSSKTEETKITVHADLDVSVRAFCKDSPTGRAERFTQTNIMTYELIAKMSGGPLDCLFEKKVNSDVYTLTIEIAFGDILNGTKVTTQMERYIITCTYDLKGVNIEEAYTREIKHALVQPVEVQVNSGDDTTATLQLQLVDVIGSPIVGDIQLGRNVGLKGVLSGGNGSEVGLRVVSCIAIGGSDSYAFLRGGCGDGVIFNQSVGFTTKGKIVESPYFSQFKLHSSTSLRFSCNFTVCFTNCDGSSCTNARKKRDVFLYDDFPNTEYVVTSPTLDVQSNFCTSITPDNEKLVFHGHPQNKDGCGDTWKSVGWNYSTLIAHWMTVAVLGTLFQILVFAVFCAIVRERRPRQEEDENSDVVVDKIIK